MKGNNRVVIRVYSRDYHNEIVPHDKLLLDFSCWVSVCEQGGVNFKVMGVIIVLFIVYWPYQVNGTDIIIYPYSRVIV